MKGFEGIVVLLAFCCGHTAMYAQTQVVIPITEDASAYYKEGTTAMDNSYSTGNNNKVGTGTAGGAATKNRAYIKLDLSSIPAKALVTNATLKLYSLQAQSTTDNKVWLRRVEAPWVLGSMTWNNQPYDQNLFEATDPFIPPGGAGYLDVDITDWINETVTEGGTYFSFLMHLDNETGGYRSQKIAAYEHTTAAYRPQLLVTYVNNPIYLSADFEESKEVYELFDGIKVKLDEHFLLGNSEAPLEYEIRNRNNVEIIARTSSGLSLQYPFIEIDNTSFSINSSMEYKLIVYNEKGEKRYLKFKQ